MVRLMNGRIDVIDKMLHGYQHTGLSWIAKTDSYIGPWNGGDDMGIYYFIPKLAHALGLSVQGAIDIFFISMWGFALVLGFCGLMLICESWIGRGIATIGLAGSGWLLVRYGDTYSVGAAFILVAVPWILWITKTKYYHITYCLFAVMGVLSVCAHYIRGYSSFGVLLFACIIVLCGRGITKRTKALLIGFLCAGIGIASLWFSYEFYRYRSYVRQHCAQSTEKNLDAHVIWHAVYVGLGYLNWPVNKHGITYSDTCAADRAHALESHICNNSPAYEALLKQEVLNIVRTDFFFVLQTLFAKIGVLLLYLLLGANLGLLAAWFYRKPWYVDIAFAFGLASNAVYGLIAIPLREYLLGFIMFAVLYGVVSIDHALQQGMIADLKRLVVRCIQLIKASLPFLH